MLLVKETRCLYYCDVYMFLRIVHYAKCILEQKNNSKYCFFHSGIHIFVKLALEVTLLSQ